MTKSDKQTDRVVKVLREVVKRIESLADDVTVRTSVASLEKLQDKNSLVGMRNTHLKLLERIQSLNERILRVERSHVDLARVYKTLLKQRKTKTKKK